MMKAAIVTGAGGFIGGALTENLLGKGVRVYGVDISQKALERHGAHPNFIPVIADFSQYGQLHERLRGPIDVFYHFARQGGFGAAFRDYRLQLNNSIADCDALMAAVRIGCRRFVFAGTVNEYAMETFMRKDRFEARYTYIYSVVKQASEGICKTLAYNEGIEFCTGRIAMAYGENFRSPSSLPNVVIGNLLKGVPCKLIEGRDPYDMIYIADIAEAFYAIGERGADMKSYYVGHRQVGSFREIMERIAGILNPECPLLFGAYPDAPSGVNYADIDLDALYRDTGFECRADFKESILRTAAWVKAEQEKPSGISRGGGQITS